MQKKKGYCDKWNGDFCNRENVQTEIHKHLKGERMEFSFRRTRNKSGKKSVQGSMTGFNRTADQALILSDSEEES